jgi:hypothetical protein
MITKFYNVTICIQAEDAKEAYQQLDQSLMDLPSCVGWESNTYSSEAEGFEEEHSTEGLF